MAREGCSRVNITISEELKIWFQKQAEEFGVPMSGMMAIALAQYKQQIEGLSAMKEMGVLYEKLNDIQNQIDSKDAV